MKSTLSPFQISLGRRALLRNLGFATAGALTGTAWERAQAATKPPTRIIFFYTDNGTLQPSWRPGPIAGKAEATENEWQLGELHAGILDAHKKDLIYIENVDLISTDLDLSRGSGSHERMQTHMLNGSNRAGVNRGGAMTIDQYIAKQLNSPKALTAFPSLEYCVQNHHYISWSGAGLFVEPEYSPLKAYDRIFKMITPAQTGEAAAQAAAAKAARRRKSIFDTLSADFGSVKSGLSSNSKAKIEAHATTLRDLESRLSIAQPAACAPPKRDLPLSLEPYVKAYNFEPREYWDGAADAYIRMATAALACDLTRVVTIEMGNPPGSITGTVGDIHLEHVHGVHSAPTVADLKKLRGYEEMTKYHRWYAQQFANLISMLKSIPEGEPGETLFDHTVIYWFTPMGQGNHDAHQIPYVLAGSANGYFRTGRYIKFDRRPATEEEKQIDKIEGEDKAVGPPTRGMPHNDLLVSLVNAMGFPITTYGNPKCCNGPLARLKA